jgi:hypothetical protein
MSAGRGAVVQTCCFLFPGESVQNIPISIFVFYNEYKLNFQQCNRSGATARSLVAAGKWVPRSSALLRLVTG